ICSLSTNKRPAMRLLYFLLLHVLVAVFLPSVDAASPISFTAGRNQIVAKRHLRTETRSGYDGGYANTEERGVPVAAVEQLASMNPYKAKLAKKAFKLLNLHKRKGFIMGTPELKTWSNLMLKLDDTNSKGSMVAIMTRYYGDDALARYIQSAKVSPSVGKLATDLQTAQFAQWARRGETAKSIKQMLRNSPDRLSSWRDDQVVNAFTAFLTKKNNR
ncbi:hypothetical protein F441_00654, partial [Phytophthora nicotianae CJ01A1]